MIFTTCTFVLPLWLLAGGTADAFSIVGQTSLLVSPQSLKVATTSVVTAATKKGGEDDVDDWYADFNPAEFEASPTATSSGRILHENGFRRQGGSEGGAPQDGYERRRSSSRRSGSVGGGGGHGYVRDTSRDNSNVDEAAVNRLLQARVDARRGRDFDLADQYRDELLNDHGVRVFDKELEWRTGASASGSGMGPRRDRSSSFDRNSNNNNRRGGGADRFQSRQQRPRQDFGPLGHDYELAPDAGPNASQLSDDQIHELVAERLQCKLMRSFRRADDIQVELSQNGVYLHDGMKQWRADGKLFGEDSGRGGKPGKQQGSRSDRDKNKPYTQSEYSMEGNPMSSEQMATIDSLIAKRNAAKISRDYDTADSIREELKEVYDIFLDDRLREWSVGGDFGPESPGSLKNSKANAFVMSRKSVRPENPQDVQEIESLLAQRNDARKSRDFATADEIRAKLLDTYNVEVNDRKGEWWIEPTRAEKPSEYFVEGEEDEEFEGNNTIAMEEDTLEEDNVNSGFDGHDESYLATLTVVELKEKLRQAGLPVSGKKEELISRLVTDK